jgi:hypothetical protein
MTLSIFDVPCVALTTRGLVLRSVPVVLETAWCRYGGRCRHFGC